MTEFNLSKKRKELLKRFSETPLLDVMPLIEQQDKEFIQRLIIGLRDRFYIAEKDLGFIKKLAGKSLIDNSPDRAVDERMSRHASCEDKPEDEIGIGLATKFKDSSGSNSKNDTCICGHSKFWHTHTDLDKFCFSYDCPCKEFKQANSPSDKEIAKEIVDNALMMAKKRTKIGTSKSKGCACKNIDGSECNLNHETNSKLGQEEK